MKALLVALTLIAAAIGGAGAATLALERRVAALAPGGVEVATFDYNPLTGRLALAGVRARDAAGRELFRADHVVATVNPLRLLTRPLTLSRARVEAPVLTLRAGAGLDLAELAAGLGAAPAAATGLPVRIDDLVIAGGRLVVEGASEGGAAAGDPRPRRAPEPAHHGGGRELRRGLRGGDGGVRRHRLPHRPAAR